MIEIGSGTQDSEEFSVAATLYITATGNNYVEPPFYILDVFIDGRPLGRYEGPTLDGLSDTVVDDYKDQHDGQSAPVALHDALESAFAEGLDELA